MDLCNESCLSVRSSVHLAWQKPKSLTLHAKLFNQTFFVPAMFIGTNLIDFHRFTDLDLVGGLQGHCKATPVGIIFLHASSDEDEI